MLKLYKNCKEWNIIGSYQKKINKKIKEKDNMKFMPIPFILLLHHFLGSICNQISNPFVHYKQEVSSMRLYISPMVSCNDVNVGPPEHQWTPIVKTSQDTFSKSNAIATNSCTNYIFYKLMCYRMIGWMKI